MVVCAPRRLDWGITERDAKLLPDCCRNRTFDEEVLKRFRFSWATFAVGFVRLDDVLVEKVCPRVSPVVDQ